MIPTFTLIGQAFETYFKKENLKYLIKISLVQILVTVASSIPIFIISFTLGGVTYFGGSPERIQNISPIVYMVLAPLSVVFAIFVAVVGTWTKASGLVAVSHVVKKEITGVNQTLRLGWKKTGKLFLVNLLGGLIVLLGLILFIVPGIIFAVWFSFSSLFVIEGLGVVEALRQSKALVKGHFFRVALRYVAFGLLAFAIYMLLNFIPVLGPIALVLFAPFYTLLTYLLFFDLKKLRES